MLALKTLIDADVQVINISQNTCRLIGFAASHGNQNAIAYLSEQAELASIGLSRIIYDRNNEGKTDFVICVAAGNNNSTYYYKDEGEVYGYRETMNWWEKIKSIFGWHGEIGNSEAKYNNFLNLIDDEDVKSHIIVVGAIKIDYNDSTSSETNYEYAYFSNIGNRVDVVAPGVDVYSSVVTGYANMSGTSMATPHVTGVVGLMFACNQYLSAEEVKATLKNSCTAIFSFTGGSAGLVNAANAVETVLKEAINSTEPTQEPVRITSDERDIVLVLDVSGSMSGTPMEETKKASMNFIDSILEEDASIGVVTYDDNAEQLTNFSVDKDHLTEIISALSDGGGTNIEAGLTEAQSMLDSSSAKKKIIVLMSDGEPNEGKEGEELIAYADQIKSDDILIYTLGFFENMGGNKSSAQYLMEQLASDGCHYEVANADDLVFFFEDMADQINGQKYIYIRIACPVDVSVTYNGETLNSAEENQVLRTDFGTLTFEDSEETSSNQAEEQIKVLRLKEGVDYNVKIVGNGRGIMDYTIGFMDENGDYSDFRRFEDIKITKETVIDTVATVSEESVLNIDEDGDGNYDLKLRANENGFGEEVKQVPWLYIVIGGVVFILVVALVVSVRVCNKKRRAEIRVISKYCGNCGAKLENSEKVCRHCGRPVDSFLTTASGVIVVGSNRQKKVKRTVRWIAGLIVTVIIATLAVNIASNFTGYYSLLGKILNAYEDDDIDAFVSLSSNAYYYSDENWVENYFENSVSFSLDFFETAVGYRYNLSYEVNEIYVMSERK